MITLRTLGSSIIQIDDLAIGPDAERLFGVLLYLVTERERRTARRSIQELLWPEASEEHGRHNLRQVIYKLRQYGVELGGGGRDVYLPADQLAVDPFDVLSGDAASAGDALLAGQVGEYLAGYSPEFSEPYAAWVEGQRAYAHARVARAAVGAMLERRARGRWDDVDRLAQICLRYDPLNEEATLALAESTALAGSKARALAILDQYILELGENTSIQLPAALLRRRIAERLPDPPYTAPSEACFAGRDESLRALHELFGHARAGRGQSCMIVGDPGVGKTRLATEFARVATLQGAQVQHMECRARDGSRPLSVFTDGVPALLKLPGAIGCSPRSMSFLKRLTEHDPTTATPSEDSREADFLYANVRRAVLDLIGAVANERTLLLVIEDVHWADAASWDVLRDLIASCSTHKLLLVLTSRAAHVPHAMVERLPLRVHRLAPLAADAAAQLLDAIVDERQRRPTDALRGWLLRAADGNPMFLRELAIHWLETGREGEVPPSLAALLRERLSRLTPLALRIFQTCAIMGNKASFERIERILEYKRHEVLDGLQELESAGLLRSRADGVHSRHELLADEAVAELAESARKYLHRQVALVLESQVRAAVPADASVLWDCAEQWRLAGELGRAWQVATACGGYLLEVGLPSDAADVFEKAQQYSSTPEEAQSCRVGLAAALMHGGRWDRAQQALSEIVRCDADRSLRNAQTVQAHLHLLEADLWLRADVTELLARSKTFLSEDDLQPNLRVQFGIVALKLSDYLCSADEMLDAFDKMALSLVHPDVNPVHRATANMIYHAACGELDIAHTAARELLQYRRQSSSPATLSSALRVAAYVYRRCGDISESHDRLVESAAVAEANSLATHAALSCGFLAQNCLYQVDYPQSHAWYDKVVYWLSQSESPATAMATRLFCAKLALAENRLEDANASLTEGFGSALQNPDLCRRADAEAVHLHMMIAQGSTAIPIELLADFRRTFDRVRTFGGQDYPALVKYLIDRRENEAEARSELLAYVATSRRERGPLPRMLSDLLAET